MKKLFIIGLLVALLLIAMPAMAFVCSPTSPTFDLLAGQTTPVGTVTVCNDETNLYVTFATTGIYKMRETHLDVEMTMVAVPQKNGNPIPGKFAYKTLHSPSVSTYQYTVPKPAGASVVIAAHASLDKEDVMTFYSDAGNTMVTAGNVPLATYPYPAVDAWEAFGDPVDSTPSFWDTSLSPQGIFPLGDWIWESYRVVDPTVPQSVTFEKAFTVPGEPTSGKLWIAEDNQYVASLNGAAVGSQTNYNNWPTVGIYDILPTTGVNTLQIVGTNYGDGSYTLDSNPAGLIFKGEVKYLVPSETAWATGAAFPGKNWATYITYTVQGECDSTPLDTVSVYALNVPVATSSVAFENGKIYKLVASGTAHANDPIVFDAKYSFNNGDGGAPSTEWTDSVLHYESYGPQLLDLYVNGNNIDWGPFSLTHVYNYKIVGTGTPATFNFQINDFYPTNDYGQLTIDIYKCNW